MQIVFVVIVMLVFFGGIGGAIWYFLKKTAPVDGDTSELDSITTAQEFLPFSDICNDMIVLPGQKYRAVLECSSMNYQLKTASEREQIEMSFQRFLNSIQFPITFFLQTKTIDNSHRLKNLDIAIAQTLQKFPSIENYAKQYRRDMEYLNAEIGNSHQKKRYIIVSYDNVAELDNLTRAEQEIYAAKEIRNRCNMIMSNLDGVGVHSRILNTKDLIELVYSCYYRDDYSYSECISDGDAFKLLVDGAADRFKDITKEDLLRILYTETINKIRLENLDTTDEGKALLNCLYNISSDGGKPVEN